MDPTSAAVGAGISLLGTGKVVEKILGPTAEYIGDGLKAWTEKRVQNTKRIFASAERHLGAKLDEVGSVPPKVLKEVLEEGSYCDEQLAVEYFGGVLASSRGPTSRDDRGAILLKTIASLTTYQLRAHYILYSKFLAQFRSRPFELGDTLRNQSNVAFVGSETFDLLMDYSNEPDPRGIVMHTLFGLRNAGLIGDFASGQRHSLEILLPNPKGVGIAFRPTVPGAELFLWATGQGKLSVVAFFQASDPEILSASTSSGQNASSIPEITSATPPEPARWS